MSEHAMLLFYQFGTNTGYALRALEEVFYQVALHITGSPDRVHVAYPDLSRGPPEFLAGAEGHVWRFDPADRSAANCAAIRDYVGRHHIDIALGFDQPVGRPAWRAMRRGGVRAIVSYWGAPMSGLNRGLKLWLKKVEVRLRTKPDHFVFESQAMIETAVHGRGIDPRMVSLVHMGVDPACFHPDAADAAYAHAAFHIPPTRRIVFYSGHMEERKGVHVLVRAAADLINVRGRRDVHFLLVGNRNGEHLSFLPLYAGTPAEQHITFGGYRRDVPRLLRSGYLGAIASTGWDSFTQSSLEMAATGLPLVVSRLQGLRETVESGVTGELVEPGDHRALADTIAGLLDDQPRRDTMSLASRQRVLRGFTRDRQIAELTGVIRRVVDAA